MKLYHTTRGIILEHAGDWHIFADDWDTLINGETLYADLKQRARETEAVSAAQAAGIMADGLLAPLKSQEVWAAGVTYLISRDARKEEASAAGGGDFYERVYEAERPELFFKAQPHRVAAHWTDVYIREDSAWNVPEPELAIFINRMGNIAGYTIGNDMSSRSIEGENPLYLPQAKVYERSAALGPCLYIPDGPLPADTPIQMTISRGPKTCFSGEITLDRMKRSLKELARYLYLGFDFPSGSFLMTGTCLVPGSDFTLAEGDIVDITIGDIGTLTNIVRVYRKTSKQ